MQVSAEDLPQPVVPTMMKCLPNRSSTRSRAGTLAILIERADFDGGRARRRIGQRQGLLVGQMHRIADRGQARDAAAEDRLARGGIGHQLAGQIEFDEMDFLLAGGDVGHRHADGGDQPQHGRARGRESSSWRRSRRGGRPVCPAVGQLLHHGHGLGTRNRNDMGEPPDAARLVLRARARASAAA